LKVSFGKQRNGSQTQAKGYRMMVMRAASLQLMAFLSHVGFDGNAASIHMISLDLEIGLGTVEQYYQQCLVAIHSW
jgi:hypothetical protein